MSYVDEQVIDTLVVIPPDGGWGWVVVFGSFCCCFIIDGTMYTFGIFIQEIALSLRCSQTEIAFSSSLMTGLSSILGPVFSAMTNRYGFRIVAFVGSSLGVCCYLLSSYASNVQTFTLAHGVLGGIAFGMLYVPVVIIVGFYFERWRALATSMAVCGSSVGIVCFPFFIQTYLGNETWRIKFRAIGAATSICMFASLLFRSIAPVRVLIDQKQSSAMSRLLQRINENARGTSCLTRFCCCFMDKSNAFYPTTAEIHGPSAIMLVAPSKRRFSSATTVATTMASWNRLARARVSEDTSPPETKKCPPCSSDCFTCSCCKESDHITAARPLYRDDIFYNGSVVMLPEYQQSLIDTRSQIGRSLLDYHMSVTHAATQRDLEEEVGMFVCCPSSVTRVLATMLDLSILKSPSFLILAFSGFFSLLGLYTPFLLIADRAMASGMNKESAYMLLSTLGFANGVGRLLSGVLSSFPNIKAVMITYVSLIIAGTATFLSQMRDDKPWLFTYAIIYGATVACVASIRSIIIVDLVGLEKLTNAFGMNMVFQGTACIIGIPLSGYFRDMTGKYDLSFYFAAGVLAFSGILLIPIRAVKNWEERRNRPRNRPGNRPGNTLGPGSRPADRLRRR